MRGGRRLSRLQLKIWLATGVAVLVGFLAVQIDHYRASRQDILDAVLIEARTLRAVLTATRAVYDQLFLASDLPITDQTVGLLPIHAMARMTDEMRAQGGAQLKIKIASIESPNPGNRPDAVESEALAYFAATPEADELLTPFETPNGRHFYYYTQPIRTESYCLACHGAAEGSAATAPGQLDPASGYAEGSIRGITSIKLAVDDLEARADAFFLTSLRDHVLVFVILFVIGGALLQHFVIGRVKRIQAGTAALEQGDYATRLPALGDDELAELARSFNRMADAIALRDRQLRDAQASAQLGFWTLDARSRAGEWSAEVYRIMGLDPTAPATQKTLRALLDPRDAEQVEAALEDGLAKAREHAIDYRIRRPSGEARWVHCRSRPITDRKGRVVRLEGYLQDITERKAAERALREREQTLSSLFRAAPIGIGLLRERVLAEVNETFCAMLGYSREELLGQGTRRVYPSDGERDRVDRTTRAQIERTGTGRIDTQLQRKTGEPIDVLVSATPIDKDEPAAGITFTALDITEEKRAKQALEAERTFLQNVIDGIDDPILVIGTDYRILRMNRVASQAAAAAGLGSGKLACHQISHRSDEACSGDDHPCPLQEVLATGRPCKVIHNHCGRNGEPRTFEVVATPLRNEANALMGIIESSRDITEQLALMEELREKDLSYAHLVQHDSLTGLPNRLLFADRLSQGIRRAHRRGTKLAVLFVDLDRFKHINDSFDHTYGDAVLRAVAERLRGLFREDDTVARMGGDEFAVILTEIKRDSDAALVARKVLGLFAEAFEIQGHGLFLGACVGLSLYPEHGTGVDELVRNADAAMHRAKEEGRNTYQYYAQELTSKAFERVLLEASLHQAVTRDELVLHYQPQLDLATGAVRGVEALVRWQHPEMGLVSPARFITLAEESGIILGIGEWVLREATRQMKLWQETGALPPSALMSVNLSVKQFDQKDMVEMVHTALEDSGLDSESLELEITESIMMQAPELSAQRLARLRKLGVRIAVDDFGTGYSSLGYLRSLPLTKLKIDQSFVADLPSDPNNIAIARAVIGLAHSLSLEVLAEGIETREQLDFLVREGCQIGQGYRFSRPLDAEALERYLREHKESDWAPIGDEALSA